MLRQICEIADFMKSTEKLQISWNQHHCCRKHEIGDLSADLFKNELKNSKKSSGYRYTKKIKNSP